MAQSFGKLLKTLKALDIFYKMYIFHLRKKKMKI